MSDPNATRPSSTPAHALHNAKCSRTDCEASARFIPSIELFDAAEQPVGRLHPQIVACEEHSRMAALEDFIPEQEWDRIVQAVRASGKPAPVKRLAKVVWQPLRDLTEADLQALAIAAHSFIIEQLERGMFIPSKENGEQLVVLSVALASMFADQFELDREVIKRKVLGVLEAGLKADQPTIEEQMATAFGAPRGAG